MTAAINTSAPDPEIEKLVAEFRKLLTQAKAQTITGNATALISHNMGGITGRKMGLEWTIK